MLSCSSHHTVQWSRLVPELVVSDYDRARQFYVEVLGFQLCFERPEDRFGYLDWNAAQLMLLERPMGSAPLPPVTDTRQHFQIEVETLTPLLTRLETTGHALERAPYIARYRGGDCVYVQREFFIRDRDGYLLRFFEHLAEEPLPRG